MAVLIITVEHGSFSYDGKTPVFQDVNLTVRSGDFLAILGPNGTGKTTLLRCIMGMLRWQSGRSALDGVDIRTIPGRQLWSRMAYVPQAKGAASSYTALETVLLGRSSKLNPFSAPKRADVEKAEQTMEDLGILSLRDKKCNAMSGGELQMVLIARAMVVDPELLILDEPESNLDFKNQLIVMDAMSRLVQNGIACIFNTHYPEHALQRADKALILSHGTARFGETAQVLTEESIQQAFGVQAVIGEIETPEMIYRNVVPLRLAAGDAVTAQEDSPCLAATSIIVYDTAVAEKINALLHEYRDLVIGRMGLPYREGRVSIIHVTFDGRHSRIEELTQKLSILRGISVKTTFAPVQRGEVSR